MLRALNVKAHSPSKGHEESSARSTSDGRGTADPDSGQAKAVLGAPIRWPTEVVRLSAQKARTEAGWIPAASGNDRLTGRLVPRLRGFTHGWLRSEVGARGRHSLREL